MHTIAVGSFKAVQALYLLFKGTHFDYNHENLAEYSEDDLTHGPFRKVYFLNEKNVSFDEIIPIFEEEVVQVERCCCSLFGRFPSGIASVFTWALAGATVRHEYCLIQTTNYKILIEIKGGGSKSEAYVSINIRNLVDKKKLLKDKWYNRCLAKAEKQKLVNLDFFKVLGFINAWIILTRHTDNGKYNLLDRNCKTLARSVYYFSVMDLEKTIDSIFGNWVEKPLNVPHLDLILLNKISHNIAQWWDDSKRREVQNIIGKIRYS